MRARAGPAVSGSGSTTIPSSTEDTAAPRGASRSAWALVRVWSRHQPRTIGEIAFLDPEIHPEWSLGCDEDSSYAPVARARFFRQLPGSLTPGEPITGRSVSRDQVRFDVTQHTIAMRKTGKEQVFVNGTPVPDNALTPLGPGSLILLRRHSAYLVVRRPLEMAPVPAYVLGTHVFSEPDPDGIVGESPGAWAMRLAAASAGRSNRHSFLYGESGSGKELLARGIHRHSARKGEYVAANAAALPESILELELFGCAKDYPNPRSPERPGYIGRTERGGTLFLDEFGQLTEDMQARMLRAMQGESVRLGTYKPYRIDTLIIAATNKVGFGVKHDVLKRFTNVVTLPSLRDRLEDVPLIAREIVRREARKNPDTAARFLRREPDGYEHAAFSSGLVQTMLGLPLDGNVRDIENLLVVAMQETKSRAEADGNMDGPLTVQLPADMTRWRAPPSPPPAPRTAETREADDEIESLLAGYTDERARIVTVLESAGWNVELAAKRLGMTRDQLRYRMKKLRIRRPGRD